MHAQEPSNSSEWGYSRSIEGFLEMWNNESAAIQGSMASILVLAWYIIWSPPCMRSSDWWAERPVIPRMSWMTIQGSQMRRVIWSMIARWYVVKITTSSGIECILLTAHSSRQPKSMDFEIFAMKKTEALNSERISGSIVNCEALWNFSPWSEGNVSGHCDWSVSSDRSPHWM
jgi:hypothetical protein